MLFLIVGRTGSGKDYLAKKIIEHYKELFPGANEELKLLKSYATRPPRTPDEDTHIFIAPENAGSYENKVAITSINGYEYFSTAEQVNDSDIYIIDPKGLYELVENMPDETFHVIYVYAEDDDRLIQAVKRADDKIAEEEIFNERDASENKQFSEFEEKLREVDNETIFAKNVTCVYKFANTYDEATTDKYAEFLCHTKNLHNKMVGLIKEGIGLDIIPPNKNDKTKVDVKTTNGENEAVTIDRFADIVGDNDSWTSVFMRELIMKSPRFSDI